MVHMSSAQWQGCANVMCCVLCAMYCAFVIHASQVHIHGTTDNSAKWYGGVMRHVVLVAGQLQPVPRWQAVYSFQGKGNTKQLWL